MDDIHNICSVLKDGPHTSEELWAKLGYRSYPSLWQAIKDGKVLMEGPKGSIHTYCLNQGEVNGISE